VNRHVSLQRVINRDWRAQRLTAVAVAVVLLVVVVVALAVSA